LAPPPARDRELELAFLDDIDLAACGYTRRVLDRLDRVGRITGRNVPDITVAQALAEAREECEDLAGWPLMALHLATDLHPATRDRLRERLVDVGRLAAAADAILTSAISEIATELVRA
jgi:hypothetical protein